MNFCEALCPLRLDTLCVTPGFPARYEASTPPFPPPAGGGGAEPPVEMDDWIDWNCPLGLKFAIKI